MLKVRQETPEDYSTIRQIIVDAFTQSEFGHNGEANIVEQLRENCPEAISFVATEDSEVVGHIMFSPVVLSTELDTIRGLGLGPMAVRPDRQRKGIGAALVEYGLYDLKNKSWPFVTVLGHPEYYPRFGFRPAVDEFQVRHGFKGIGMEYLLLKVLDETFTAALKNGAVNFREEFGVQSF